MGKKKRTGKDLLAKVQKQRKQEREAAAERAVKREVQAVEQAEKELRRQKRALKKALDKDVDDLADEEEDRHSHVGINVSCMSSQSFPQAFGDELFRITSNRFGRL